LQQLGVFAGRYKTSLFEALFAASLESVIKSKALAALHEFGRYVNDLEFRARHTEGAEAARAFLTDWLQEIGYEKYLYDHQDNAQDALARWANVLDFCDWMAARCGGQIEDEAGLGAGPALKNLLEVAQTVSLLSTLNVREKDQDVVTLSTLHAAKGLEWPHVTLAGVIEGMLPFSRDERANAPTDKDHKTPKDDSAAHQTERTARLQEERRLMYVGITRAQRTLVVSWSRQRRRAPTQASRFIAEMALDQTPHPSDPRAKLKALRAEFAQRALDKTSAQTASDALLEGR
jgi:ATP-dependent DNA helicase Rep